MVLKITVSQACNSFSYEYRVHTLRRFQPNENHQNQQNRSFFFKVSPKNQSPYKFSSPNAIVTFNSYDFFPLYLPFIIDYKTLVRF